MLKSPLTTVLNKLHNRNGNAKGLGEHFVAINADHYLPTSDKQIPLGNLEDVGGSVFDLRIPRKLSEMLPNCPGGENNGYDHNFCVNGKTDLFR